MKHLLTLAIVLSTATAFATRSRVTALGNAPHLIDVAQSSPDQLLPLGDSLTIESGVTTNTFATGQNSGAEGWLYKTFGGGKLGLGLGHQDSLVFSARNEIFEIGSGTYAAGIPAVPALAPIRTQQNPLNVSYSLRLADLNAGFGIIYSNYNDKVTEEKESTMGLQAGVSSSLFYANAKIIVADTWETPAIEYKGKASFDIKAGYYMGDLSVHGNIVSRGATVSDATGDLGNLAVTTIDVKVIDTIKSDSNFFYGVGLNSTTKEEKESEYKSAALNLPIIIGLETAAASWLTFRGSVTQDVLLSNEKSDLGPAAQTETNPGLNTTTFAAGVGINFNKITVDGAIMTAGSQNIDATAGGLLTTVGLTYNF